MSRVLNNLENEFLDLMIEVSKAADLPFKQTDQVKKTFNRAMAREIVRRLESNLPRIKELAERLPKQAIFNEPGER
jgi:hypothetical protein